MWELQGVTSTITQMFVNGWYAIAYVPNQENI